MESVVLTLGLPRFVAPVQILFGFQLDQFFKFESRAVKSGTLAEACFRDRPSPKMLPAVEFDAFNGWLFQLIDLVKSFFRKSCSQLGSACNSGR